MPPSRRDVTIADVARRAGVSRAQTARALGGYGAVSDAVHSRVVAAAEELGYRANGLARSVSTGRSQSVGVVIGDVENPFFGLSMRGMSDTFREAGYDVLLMNTGESAQLEVEAIRSLDRKRVDGFVVAPAIAGAWPHLEGLAAAGRPLVLFDRAVPGLDASTVLVDVSRASQQLTGTLVAAGHRRLGFVSTLRAGSSRWSPELRISHTPVGRRIDGMIAALQEAGLEADPETIRLGARGADDVRRIVRDLATRAEPVTALLASDSLIAAAALEELRELGLSVPGDISLATFDDPPWAGLVSPPLTVVSQPVLDAGIAAARLLLAQMRGEAPLPPPHLEARLLERGSIGPAPSWRGRDRAPGD
ncbi:LacI family DNA-binding transcriptional regulator [Brachybacterium hainanense]|uniref:LacI family DNA-binding transcriptional regulator n=1 Tax=Brachybacterium hainanense TaxID=1541174 RepID=A0ABV6R6Z7_9MICO